MSMLWLPEGRVLFLLLLLFSPCVQGECTKRSSCSCNDPQNGLIDLSPLDGKGTPWAKDQNGMPGDTYLYSWNPCSPFSELDCNNVAGCQLFSNRMLSNPIGTQDSATFTTDSSTGQLKLTYTTNDRYGRKSTLEVTLLCEPTAIPGNLKVIGQTQPRTYTMELSSIHCCAGSQGGGGGGGLSVGSILLMGLLVMLVVYAVVGAAVMKFGRHAQGKEIIPNYTIWAAVPSLIKDGVLYTFRCACSLCGRRNTYDKI